MVTAHIVPLVAERVEELGLALDELLAVIEPLLCERGELLARVLRQGLHS